MSAASSRRKASIDPRRVAFGLAVALFAVARLVPFAHARVGLVLDSFDYLNLAGHKSPIASLAASRPPTYLLFVKLLGGRKQWITWAQFTIGVVSWALLAAVWSRRLRSRVGRILGVVAVLLLGSCIDVVQWDRLIGTESLSISLGVMLVAAALWLQDRPSPARAAMVCTVALLWGMLRDSDAIVLGVVGVGVAVWVIVRRPRARVCFVAIAIACLVTSAASLASADVGTRWRQPVQNVITFRVLSSPERETYFLDHGLPLTPAEARHLAGHCVNPAGVFLCRKITDPAFYRWINRHARGVYLRSWFSFPVTTLWEPVSHARSMIGVRLPLAAIAGTGLDAPHARAVETLIFPRSPRVLLGWLLVSLVALGVITRRKGWIRAATVPIAMLALTYPHLAAVWSGDAIELGRHGLAASVQLRLGLWLLTVALVDACLPNAEPASARR